MNSKRTVLALCALAVLGALAPATQAAHYTAYHALGMHRQIGSFEDASTDLNNKNGPGEDDDRPIPADADVPARFRGLDDILRNGVTDGFNHVLDHQMYGSTVEAGHVVPYGYYVSNAGGQARTSPTSIHALWLGKWNDKSGDGVIDDVWCSSTGGDCGGADEFIWRGKNTGESLNALLYIFPGDYSPSGGTGGYTEPSPMAGDCTRFTDNTGCINPGPDELYADSTENSGNAQNQRWAAGSGGGQTTPEEFLLVNQHIVTVVGTSDLAEGSAEQFRVDCSSLSGCLRDYDWYQGLAGDDVNNLYLGALRPVRDAVWVPVENFEPDLGVLEPILQPVLDTLEVEVCPHNTPQCPVDRSHLDAVGAPGAAYKTLATQTFTTVVPMFAGTPAIGPVPPQGFYGDALGIGAVGSPYSTVRAGGFVRATLGAWLWDDANGDGYIGRPPQAEINAYNAGIDNSPNNGMCDRSAGGDCELIPRADVYDGKTVSVTPGAGGWPPGSAQFNNYEQGEWGMLGFPSPNGGWFQGFLAGSAPATLRADSERCKAQAFACRTLDAVFVPSGSVFTLNGAVSDGVTVSWTEGAASFSVSFPGTWTSTL